jgi:REP element-mobilizing transposase RayT
MPYHSRATAQLLPGRISSPGACYFLTWCTRDRAQILAAPRVRQTASAEIVGLGKSGDGVILAATIMPDHVHLLLQLGARLAVSQIVAKTKASVTRTHPSVQWQLNFFEHRLRDASKAESFAFYLFMNPYTAGLCSLGETWPGWIASPEFRWSFENKLREGRYPHAEWLPEAARFARTLPAGAD